MTTLLVRGGRPLRGDARVPGDKSVSHRALLLGSIADGVTRIHRLSACGDVQRTLACLTALGVTIERPSPGEAIIHGRGIDGLRGAPVRLDCGDSGTTMRLLAGLLAGQQRAFVLDGAPGLRRRPMRRLVEPLAAMGARLATDADGHPPVSGTSAALCGAEIALTHASAQLGSAVLLAGLRAAGTTVVHYPAPVRDHTERMLADMGAPLAWSPVTTRLDGPVASLRPAGGGALEVPGDLSGAAFLLGAAAIVPGSSIVLRGVGINPGRTGILDILAAMGADTPIAPDSAARVEPTATLSARTSTLRAVEVAGALVPRSVDELPLVGALAAAACGTTVVRDASELRVKESDRVAAIVDGLRLMGARIDARGDGFAVTGPTPLHPATVDARGDHRIAMSLAVAALGTAGETAIRDAERIADSFPGFVECLASLGADVRIID